MLRIKCSDTASIAWGPSAQNKFVFWIICHPQINHEIYVYRKQNAQGCFNQGMTRRFLQWSPIAVRHTNFILKDVFYDHLKNFEANIDLKDDHSNKCIFPAQLMYTRYFSFTFLFLEISDGYYQQHSFRALQLCFSLILYTPRSYTDSHI